MRLAERSIGRMLNIACAAPPKHTTANRQQDSQSDGKFPTEKQHADRPYETGYGKANEQPGSAIRYRHNCRPRVSNRVA